MDKQFTRALIGYKKKDVEKKVDLIDKEFEEIYTDYYRQLMSLETENKNLKQQLEMLKNEISEYRNLKEELVTILYNTHIQAYTPVYQMLKEIEEKEKNKIDILNMQKKKYADIQVSINGFLSQIQNIITNQ